MNVKNNELWVFGYGYMGLVVLNVMGLVVLNVMGLVVLNVKQQIDMGIWV